MAKTPAQSLAIFELIIYAILAPIALFVLVSHTKRKLQNFFGWSFLQSCIVLQVVAAALVLSSRSSDSSSSEIGIIISSVGLSPLLLAIEGILVEAVRGSTLETNIFFRPVASLNFHAIVVAAAALSGVGGAYVYNTTSSASDLSKGLVLLKAGVIIFVVAWLYLFVPCCIALGSWSRLVSTRKVRPSSYTTWRLAELTEIQLVLASAMALPILALRLLYTLLSVFDTHTSAFSPLSGSVAANVLLHVLPVMGAASALTIAGLLTRSGTTGGRTESNSRGEFVGEGKKPRDSLRQFGSGSV